MYLLDTNIVSYLMRGDEKIIHRVKNKPPSRLAISSVTLAEILYGVEKSPAKKEERRCKIKQISEVLRLYPFDEAAAGEYAVIRVALEKAGVMISERDTQIAAVAAANMLTVVTHNVKEFRRVEKIKVEDWAV